MIFKSSITQIINKIILNCRPNNILKELTYINCFMFNQKVNIYLKIFLSKISLCYILRKSSPFCSEYFLKSDFTLKNFFSGSFERI